MTFDFTGNNYNYFSLTTPGNACYFNKITINYITGDTPTPTYTVTYDANGGTGTMTDNSSYEAGATVTLLDNEFGTPEGKLWDSWLVTYGADNEITVTDNTFIMPASNVTVTAQWVADPNAPQYEWVLTDLADLTDEDIFVIVGNSSYAMTNDNGTSNPPVATPVTISGEKITSVISDNLKWNIDGNATDGYTFYRNGFSSYLYCNTTAASSNNNNIRVGSSTSYSRNVFELDNNNYLITKDDYAVRYLSIYNNQDWRGYINTDNVAIMSFYKRVDANAPQTPSISASNVDISYNATSGSIEYTVANEVTGGTLSASITAGNEDNWLTLGTVGETVQFTCNANEENTERTATITLTYSYGDNETVTKEVTVTQAAAPVVYATIPALFAAATSTETNVNVTFDSWVVSGVSTVGKNVFVTDGTNGFVIFDNNAGLNNTYHVGDILSGTAVSCSLKLNTGYAQITDLDANDLTITTGGTVSAANIAMADLAGVNTGALVSYNNLTCTVSTSGNYTNYDLTDGTTTIRAYTSLYDYTTTPDLENGKTYNITGIYQQYSDTKEILPRGAEDIEEVEVPHVEYTLTVSNLVNVNTYVFAGDESEMLFEGAGTAQIYDGTEVMISLDAEEGYVLQSLLVNGVEHITDIDEGMYIFNMPTNDVTVTATAVEATTYTLATSITSGKHYVIAASTSSTTKAMGGKNASKAYYNAVDASLDENTITVTANSGIQEFVICGPNADGYYTIYDPVAEGYLYASSSSSNDLSYQTTNDANGLWEIDFVNKTVTAKGSNTHNMLRYNSGNPRFSCYTSGQTAVQFYEKDGEIIPTESKTLNGSGYATYCSQNALDFTNAEGVTAWAITDVSGETITFSQISGKAPAGTGMLLKGAANADVTMTSATGAVTALSGNLLVGTLAPLTVTADEYYGLSGNTFKKVGAGTVPAGKALLPASAVGNASRLTFVFEDATGIATIEHSPLTNDRYYDMQGRRVAQPQKGLYIVNGKKVVIK